MPKYIAHFQYFLNQEVVSIGDPGTRFLFYTCKRQERANPHTRGWTKKKIDLTIFAGSQSWANNLSELSKLIEGGANIYSFKNSFFSALFDTNFR